MSRGPDAGLAILAIITGLDDYYLLPATRADLLRRLGRAGDAAIEYERVLDLAPSGWSGDTWRDESLNRDNCEPDPF
jgi:RNA polymerase sigma-70 factor (ECF subfamily)